MGRTFRRAYQFRTPCPATPSISKASLPSTATDFSAAVEAAVEAAAAVVAVAMVSAAAAAAVVGEDVAAPDGDRRRSDASEPRICEHGQSRVIAARFHLIAQFYHDQVAEPLFTLSRNSRFRVALAYRYVDE